MTAAAGPNLGLVFGYDTHDSYDFNDDFALLDGLVGLHVLSAALTSPPGSPTAGDRYIVAATASGAWTGHENKIARYRAAAWEFFTPPPGLTAYDANTGKRLRYTGSAWTSAIGLADFALAPEPQLLDISTAYTLSRALSPGTGAATVLADRIYYQPFTLPGSTINRIGVEVTTGSAGACRLGLYSNIPGGYGPDALIVDAGTVDTTSIAIVENTISQTGPTGIIWAAALFNATPGVRSATGGDSRWLGSSISAGYKGLLATQSYGALPSTAPTPTARTVNCAAVFLRRA